MELGNIHLEIFQAICALSDAQEAVLRTRAYNHINHAKAHLVKAMGGIKPGTILSSLGQCTLPGTTPAELQEYIEREGEPPLCGCGKHYFGAGPCFPALGEPSGKVNHP